MEKAYKQSTSEGSENAAGMSMVSKARVAIGRGADRYACNVRALDLIEGDIVESLKGKRRIIIWSMDSV